MRRIHRHWLHAALLLFCLDCGGGGGGPTGEGGSGGDETGGSGGRGGNGGSGGARTGGSGGNMMTGGTGGAATGGTGGGGAGGSAMDAPVADMNASGDRPGSDTGNPNAAPYVYISGYSPNILIYKLDMATGMLARVGMAAAGMSPSYLAVSPDKKYLYALNESGGQNAKVVAFAINSATGALTKINEAATAPGSGPAHISVHTSGKLVMLAHYGSGHVTIHKVKDDGGVEAPADSPMAGGNAHMILPAPDGKFVFVPCKGSDHVAQYAINEATGKLTPNTPAVVKTAGGAGPRHIAFHPTAKYAYLINELDDTMTAFDYDATTGKLSNPETLSTLPSGANGGSNSTAHVLVHPSGKFVYGSNRGHNSIVIYSVNGSGKLKLEGHETGGGEIRTPRNFTIDPTGTYLLTANQGDNKVLVFRIDATTGKLTKVGATDVGTQTSFVGVVPLP